MSNIKLEITQEELDLLIKVMAKKVRKNNGRWEEICDEFSSGLISVEKWQKGQSRYYGGEAIVAQEILNKLAKATTEQQAK